MTPRGGSSRGGATKHKRNRVRLSVWAQLSLQSKCVLVQMAAGLASELAKLAPPPEQLNDSTEQLGETKFKRTFADLLARWPVS